MKKLILALFISLLYFNISYGEYCDATFESKKLRFGHSYNFYDELVNTGNATMAIDEIRHEFHASNYGNPEFPNFKFSKWISRKNGIVGVGERGIVYESENYEIVRVPKFRDYRNIFIRYIVTYRDYVNGKVVGNQKSHIECQPYTISWCGDGVVDSDYDETCDPKDPNKKNWGNGGCNSECKPIVNKVPECKNLTSTPTTGVGSLNSNFTCSGLNASNYRIEIKNSLGQIINVINNKTGNYNFTVPGTYTAKCFAENNSSTSCEQVLTVKPTPKPQAVCENLQVSKISVERGETSTFTCNGRNTDDYKIKIVNSKGQVIKEHFGRTLDFRFPEKGTYTASCYVDNKTTTEETCVKPISVIEPIVPQINVDKRDENREDKDGNLGNDTQTIDSSLETKAVFKITVRNDGTEDLQKISLVDDVEGLDVDAPMCNKSESDVNKILQEKFGRTYLRPGEFFEYVCERKNDIRDTDTYVNKITVLGEGKISLKKVRDEDKTIVNKSKEPKIKVDKTDKNSGDKDGVQENDTQTISSNQRAIFKITVRNNGTEDLKKVQLIDKVYNSDFNLNPNFNSDDRFLNNFSALSCDKSESEVNAILRTIGNRDEIFNVGETFDYTCERENRENDSNPYTNLITVSGVGIISGKTVKDKDPTLVKKEKEPKIKVDKTDKNSGDIDGTQENDTQTIDYSIGTNAIFKITVRNNGTEDLKNIKLEDSKNHGSDVDAPMCNKSESEVNKILQEKFGRTILKPGESFDYTCQRATLDGDSTSYTNIIYVEGIGLNSGKKVNDKDPTKVTRKKKNDDNGGSAPTRCEKLTVDKTSGTSSFTSNFTCKGTGNKFVIYVKNSSGDILETIKGNNGKYTFTKEGNYMVECFNNDLSSSECKVPVTLAGGTPPPPSIGGGNGGGNYCGDGKIQRPNSKGQYEECDQGSQNGKKGSYCSSTCQMNNIETFPAEQSFEFGPRVINVIGQGMNPYTTYNNTLPYIKNINKKEGSIYVSKICVTSNSKFNKDENGNYIGKMFNFGYICEDVKEEEDRYLEPGETIAMSRTTLDKIKAKYFSNLYGTDKNLTQNDNYLVTTIITKDEETSPKYQETYFLSSGKNFVARVARGSVVTTGGGISYIAENKKISADLSKLEEGQDGKDTKAKNNKNFVGTSLNNILSSYSKQVSVKDNEKISTKVESEKTQVENKNNLDNISTINIKTTKNIGDFGDYNGITGAYILKGKSFEIGQNTFDGLTGPRTYIVQGGNLIINSDINYSDNIAFIVKGGNIIFGEKVKNANGTYISIKSGRNGGEIISKQSAEQLTINGSLYGDISKLTENRTYMKVNDKNQIDVGTIVSYGSSVFRKPAPLVSTFIDEYVNSTKVAQ